MIPAVVIDMGGIEGLQLGVRPKPLYHTDFLEITNLCGMNRLIPEVNSSQKVDHKSFINRSQSVEWMTEST